ncbi:MAG TPA: EthD family reductase [Acidimicrobiales bacterium]|nr:EthD family reductase [Acidimicrobiales bacterium]
MTYALGMVRFLVLYPQPMDREAFERHYFDVHVPLAKQLPGLRSYTVSRNASPVRGEERFFLVAVLEWDDMGSLRRDFSSALGQATARDVDELARLCPGIQSLIYEVETL